MASRYANIARTASSGSTTATALDRDAMQDRGKAQSRWIGWLAASAVLVTITLIAFSYRHQLQEISVADTVTYLQAHKWQVLPAFLLAAVAGVVILLPGAAFIVVAGAVYGMALGTVIGFTGVLAGQCAAFFLGRHMFKDTLTAWIARRFPTWGLIERALFQQGGSKLLVLLRLSPLLPDSVMNYALAVTTVKLPVFALATGIAMVPYALLYAGLGSASSDIAKTLSGDGDDTNPWLKLGMVIASVLLFAILLVYVGATLKKALAQTAVNERTGNVVVVGSGNGGGHAAVRSGSLRGDETEDEGDHHGGDVEAQPLLAGK